MITARDLKRQKVLRESTIRSLFDEILRGLHRAPAQHAATLTSSPPTSSATTTTGP